VPKIAFHVFVAVFINCTDVPDGICADDKAVMLPAGIIETPEMDKPIFVVPIFTMVTDAPIGKATDALVGIVIV
jgi:hypothetical protein